ncbi:hypothetical protein, partial [Dysgonomonas sp. 25]|uniref:hypothetical protein n=1 Tax=Dysgonomonas sp. 25 TaxID=2302933 RepID=UPI0013D8594E
PQGTHYTAKYDEGSKTFTIDLVAGSSDDVQEIYALYKESSQSYKTLGKLKVITYQRQVNRLVIVQIDKNTIVKGELEEYLKKVYSPVGVLWEVEVETYDYKGNTENFFEKGSGLLSAYNGNMKALQDAYKKHKGGAFDKNTAYVFIMGKSGRKNDRDTKGFMPKGKQFGYIFKKDLSGKDNIYQVISHELGHGRWQMAHTFDGTYGNIIKEGKSEPHNLMDYTPDGIHLAKWQWNIMNNPALLTNPFESDEKSLIEISDKEFLGLTEDGYIVIIESSKVPSQANTEGYFIKSLEYNDKTYEWHKESKTFRKDENDIYLDFSSQKDITGKVAVWHPTHKSECILLYQNIDVLNYTPTKESFASIYEKIKAFDEDINSGWIPELKAGKSDNQECLDLYYSFFSIDPKCNSTFFDLKDFKLPKALARVIEEDTDNTIETDVEDAAQKLNTLLRNDRVNCHYQNSEGSSFVSIHVDKGVPVNNKILTEIDHKLTYLSAFSAENGKPTDFYVIYQKVNRIITGDWNAYARKVYERSNLKSSNSGNVLIVIPYMEYQYKNESSVKTSILRYYMPGMHASNVDMDVNSVTKKGLSELRNEEYFIIDGNNELGLGKYLTVPVAHTYSFIKDLYTHTSKPTQIYLGILEANGCPVYKKAENPVFTKGNQFCKTILLYERPQCEQIRQVRIERGRAITEAAKGLSGLRTNDQAVIEDAKQNVYLAALPYDLEIAQLIELSEDSRDADLVPVENSVRFIEKYIEEDAEAYVLYYAFANNQFQKDLQAQFGDTESYDKNHVYDKDFLTVFDPIIYAVIDGGGMILGVVGLDVFTDVAGLAYSIARGDIENTLIYSGCALVPMASSGQYKIMKGVARKLYYKSLRLELTTAGFLTELRFKGVNGRMIDFFNLPESSLTAAELTAFSKAYVNKEVTPDMMKNILNEDVGNRAKLIKEVISDNSIMKQLQKDFAANPALLRKISSDEKLMDAWRILNDNGSQIAKLSETYLQKFSKLDPDVQVLICKLSDNAGSSSTLTKFLDDLDDAMYSALHKNPELAKGIVGHKTGINLGLSEYENMSDLISEIDALSAATRTKLTNWVERSAKASKFGEVVKLGNKLSDNIFASLKSGLDGADSRLLKLLADETGIPIAELRKYDILKEVPIQTSGGFMRADIMLIKKNAKEKIEDVIIIENKLSQTTAFTQRQKEGFGTIINGVEERKIEYEIKHKGEVYFSKDNPLKISKNRIFKMSDTGTDDISRVTINKITSIK